MVDLWSAVLVAAAGVVGSVVGAAVNELLRRSSRIEGYSARVFDKRLDAYELLLERYREAYNVASEVMKNVDMSSEKRHEAVSLIIHDIIRCSSSNELYLDDDLTAHCVATFMGAETALDFENEPEREAVREAVRSMYNEGRRMIREDSGVAGIDRLLKRIARPQISGEFIEYLRAERRKNRR